MIISDSFRSWLFAALGAVGENTLQPAGEGVSFELVIDIPYGVALMFEDKGSIGLNS